MIDIDYKYNLYEKVLKDNFIFKITGRSRNLQHKPTYYITNLDNKLWVNEDALKPYPAEPELVLNLAIENNVIRPFGDVMTDIEAILTEAYDSHDLQLGDVLALINNWTKVHYPGAIEIYVEDGSSPEFYYGPKR